MKVRSFYRCKRMRIGLLYDLEVASYKLDMSTRMSVQFSSLLSLCIRFKGVLEKKQSSL